MMSEKEESAIDQLQSLWKLENLDWSSAREVAWKRLSKKLRPSFSKQGYESVRLFYLEGIYSNYIPPVDSFVLFPYQTVEDVLLVFYSDFYNAEDRRLIRLGVLEASNDFFAEERSRVKLISDALFGSKWQSEIEKNKNAKDVELSPNPNYFASKLISEARLILIQKKDTNYSPYFDCMDYFYSCLDHANNSEVLPISKLDFLFEVIDKLKDYPKATKNSLEVAAWLEKEKDKMYEKWPFKG